MEYNEDTWDKLASGIENTVAEACEQLQRLTKETVEVRPYPDDWSVAEIIGHLIDSATNNHQRFVRLQIEDGLMFPDYSQDNKAWVTIQGYEITPFDELLALFQYYNLHLARVIRTVNTNCIDHIWVVNEDTSFTLGELMIDYLRHLKDHLEQIRERIVG